MLTDDARRRTPTVAKNLIDWTLELNKYYRFINSTNIRDNTILSKSFNNYQIFDVFNTFTSVR